MDRVCPILFESVIFILIHACHRILRLLLDISCTKRSLCLKARHSVYRAPPRSYPHSSLANRRSRKLSFAYAWAIQGQSLKLMSSCDA